MRLNDKQRSILCAAHLEPEASYKYLGRLSGYPEHVVRHTLSRLEDLGVIYKRPIITYGSLGFHAVRICFSYMGEQEDTQDRLNEYILAESRVTSSYSLGGRYQYGLLLYVEALTEVKQFLAALQRQVGIQITDKEIAIVLHSLLFRRDYLAPIEGGKRELSDNVTVAHEQLGELEKKVLAGLAQHDYRSRRELARMLRIPQSTFEYQLQKLKEKNIFQGIVYSLRERKIAALQYRLLIYTRSGDQQLHNDLLELSRSHPNVLGFFDSLGAWDYELEIETFDPNISEEFRQTLLTRFGSKIAQVHVHQLFQSFKSSSRIVYTERN